MFSRVRPLVIMAIGYEVRDMKTGFDAIRFLSNLEDACVTASRENQQFVADPWVLGPLLLSSTRALILAYARYQALAKNVWFLAQSEADSRWRVHESGAPGGMLKGQELGFSSSEDALDHAIVQNDLASRLEALKSSKEEEGAPRKQQRIQGVG